MTECSALTLSWAAFDSQKACRAQQLPDEEESRKSKSGSFRSPFARDRDRILYSKPFRRLAHKTQVYLTTESNDHFDEHCRTRLTHTLEVTQIAKSIASSLGFNTDLTEAIAYGHDVGHAPFGHAGERQIDDFLNGFVPLPREVEERLSKPEKYHEAFRTVLSRDFKHNFQSTRLLSLLESYSPFEREKGLNLTFQTLSGILQHTKVKSIRGNNVLARYPDANHITYDKLINDPDYQSIESKVVAISDEIAQVVHDLCDAMKIGAVSIEELIDHSPTKPIIDKCLTASNTANKRIDFSKTADQDESIAQFCSACVHFFAMKTTGEIARILSDDHNPKAPRKIQNKIAEKPFPEEDFECLHSFKDDLILNNFSVNRMDNRGRLIIRSLLKSFLTDPRQLPNSVLAGFMSMKRKELGTKGQQKLLKWFKDTSYRFGIKSLESDKLKATLKVIEDDKHGQGIRRCSPELVNELVPYLACDTDYLRSLADYIASMTDRFAEAECAALSR